MKKTKQYKIPFVYTKLWSEEDKDLNWVMQDYTYFEYPNHPNYPNTSTLYTPPFEWRDVYEFVDRLKINGWGKGRSAVRIHLQGTDGTKYTATLHAFMDAIKIVGIVDNEIPELKWTFTKHGTNYTIEPFEK